MGLGGIATRDIEAEYDARGLDGWSDSALVGAASDVLAVPREVDTSFALHAPLELLARDALLPLADPADRRERRLRFVSLASRHEAAGEAVPLVIDDDAFGAPEDAADALAVAARRGDPTGADRAATWIASRVEPAKVAALLAERTLDLVGAAAHFGIFLDRLERSARGNHTNPLMLRGLARRLADVPDAVYDDAASKVERPTTCLDDFDRALAGFAPAIGSPGFGILPLVRQAEEHRLLGSVPTVPDDQLDAAMGMVCRNAARSMLLDNPTVAPYHWTHSLTIPFSYWALVPHVSDKRRVLDAATTIYLALRAAHGLGPVARDVLPLVIRGPLDEAIGHSPAIAAATAWHAGPNSDVVSVLASHAGAHHDAHLVKYVETCLLACEVDPAATPLYRAAASYLCGWWTRNPPNDDPISLQPSGALAS